MTFSHCQRRYRAGRSGMMVIRSPQQEIGSVFLLPLLLLLLLVISVVGNTCGCWGTNQVYVHYNPPVSGWFRRSPKRNFLFERVYNVYTAKPQTHRFLLRYSRTTRHWLLLVKKDLALKLLSKKSPNSTGEFTVSCPTGQCSCRDIQVEGSSCWSINGRYTKYSISGQPLPTPTYKKPHDSRERRSQCLLAQIVRCLDVKEENKNPEDGCRQYTEPLINNTKLVRKQEHHIYHYHYYNLTKADNHDFWLIESENKVYAVSRNTGPCPDQLTPDSRAWVRTDDNFNENITVTCIIWDNPSGD